MDWKEVTCRLCQRTVEPRHNQVTTRFEYKCPDCGHFIFPYQGQMTEEDLIRLDHKDPEVKAKIVGWIRHQNRRGKTPVIHADKIRELVDVTAPTPEQRAMFLLEETIFGHSELEPQIDLMEPKYLNATYSSKKQDVRALLNYLERKRFVRSATSSGAVVTVEGRMMAEDSIKADTK